MKSVKRRRKLKAKLENVFVTMDSGNDPSCSALIIQTLINLTKSKFFFSYLRAVDIVKYFILHFSEFTHVPLLKSSALDFMNQE
jgi:hypothetical protein